MPGLGSPESPENTFVHTRKKTRVDWKKPKTRNRLPQTSNFKLQTRNQKPETLCFSQEKPALVFAGLINFAAQ
jgi:hypothetical protein